MYFTAATSDDRVSQESCIDGPKREVSKVLTVFVIFYIEDNFKWQYLQIFVDAQSEPEALAVTDLVEEMKVASDNEVMGDSVG